MASKFCQNCGAPLTEDLRFCPECGTPIQQPVEETASTEEAVPATAQAAPPAKKKFPWAVIAIVALCVVIGAILLATGRNKSAGSGTGGNKAESGESESKGKPEFKESGDYSGKADSNKRDSDGMTIPDVANGETLYIGYGELPDIGLTKLALVVSKDKKSIHNIAVFLDDINKTVDGTKVPFSNMQTTYAAEYTLPVKDETLGDSTLKDIHFEGDYIYMNLDYVFDNTVFNNKTEIKTIPLGEMEVWMKKAGE